MDARFLFNERGFISLSASNSPDRLLPLSPEYVGVTVNLALLYCPVKLNDIVLPLFYLLLYDSYSKDPRS